MSHADVFAQHRPRMLAAAFHITGSREDAEDVVQEAWLAWSRVDPTTVRAPGSYLGVTASRLALNAVRAQRRRRESYLGPWLPEPVVDDGSPEWTVLHDDGLGQALDFVLSTLTPEQASAYVLRKVLDVGYDEIADALEVSPAAARQLVSRAQRTITAQLGEFGEGQRTRDAAALEQLGRAVAAGDVDTVTALLSPGATLHSDGGGKRSAALRPIIGPDRVARTILGLAQRPDVQYTPVLVNGSAGLLVHEAGELTTTITLHVDAEGIRALYFVRNPDKLAAVSR